MNAYSAKICRVGTLEADFQQVPLFQFFWNSHNIVVKHKYSNSAKKSKKYFLRQKFKKYHFTIEIAQVRPMYGCKFNFGVNIWEQNTETEKTNGFW